MAKRDFTPIAPVDPTRTIPTLGMGGGDPTIAIDVGAWIAINTGDGPATLHFTGRGHELTARAWGPGAGPALESAPDMVGARDDPGSFSPRDRLVARLHREHAHVRITRSRQVTASLIRAVFGQKVTGKEAERSYRTMVRMLGTPAPGPRDGLLLPPSPDRIASLAYEDFHPWGVEHRRAQTILEVARRRTRLEETTDMDLEDAYRRITALAGVGPWSAAKVGLEALGDADAVLIGDYHLPNTVAWFLAGEPRADDDRMLELLEPYRPHRGRVVRLIKAAGVKAPKYGPRAPLRDIARF